jgi:soluble P-type ATPase
MLELNIPGWGELQFQHIVFDVNGTLALDGTLIEGVARRIGSLRDILDVHVHLLTANTHGRQAVIDQLLGLQATILQPGDEARQKKGYIQNLGAARTIAIGQGANDALMLREARLGICILSVEGLATETLLAADLLMPDIHSALDLFEKPIRLIASLRK